MTMRAVVTFLLLWSIVSDGGATDASTDDENVALSGIATQSSDYTGLMHARNAIDGNRNTNTGFYSCAFTNLETNPWWRVRLQKEYAIDSVTITSSISYLLNGAEIRIGNSLDNNGNSNPRCTVVTSISLGETRTFSCRGMRGTYVNVFLPASRNLVLCEVEVKPSTVVENMALRGKATQSSQYNFEGSAEKAIDGNLSPMFGDGSCTHSKPQTNPWWRVDLLDVYKVESVTITNRGDGSPERINGAEIRVGKSDSSIGNNNPVCATVSSIPAGASTTFQCHNMEGRYVNIIIPGTNKILTLCEVEVNASPI